MSKKLTSSCNDALQSFQKPLEKLEFSDLKSDQQVILFQTPDGLTQLDVEIKDETVWLTQDQMSLLFGKGRTTITEHISNIFQEGELEEELVCRKFRRTTKHGAIKGILPTAF